VEVKSLNSIKKVLEERKTEEQAVWFFLRRWDHR
jgi:hypothetical protein